MVLEKDLEKQPMSMEAIMMESGRTIKSMEMDSTNT